MSKRRDWPAAARRAKLYQLDRRAPGNAEPTYVTVAKVSVVPKVGTVVVINWYSSLASFVWRTNKWVAAPGNPAMLRFAMIEPYEEP